MHQAVARALEEIDAAVFSSDEFHVNREDFYTFKMYVERWVKAMSSTEEALLDYEEEHGIRLFKRGQQVKVLDPTTGSLLGKIVTVVGKNPECTAEWEVRTVNGVEWTIHSCHLQAVED